MEKKQKVEFTLPHLEILLVEDNPDNRLLIKAYLKKFPVDIDEAENGKIAVEKFKKGEYDIVLMDMQMPVMDGYAATKNIRKWEGENNKEKKPVLALTAYAMKKDKEKTLKAGCTDYLTKPIKKEKLLEVLMKLVKK